MGTLELRSTDVGAFMPAIVVAVVDADVVSADLDGDEKTIEASASFTAGMK